MLDLSKPVQTRSGHPWRTYATDGRGDRPLHGAYLSDDLWFPTQRTTSGHVYLDGSNHPLDLVNVPEPPQKREVWVNVYPCNVVGHSDSQTAQRSSGSDVIARVRVEFEFRPGDGLTDVEKARRA